MPFECFAVISDIHGNSDALAAVLADIDALQIETIINLGDHLSGPLYQISKSVTCGGLPAWRGSDSTWQPDRRLPCPSPFVRIMMPRL